MSTKLVDKMEGDVHDAAPGVSDDEYCGTGTGEPYTANQPKINDRCPSCGARSLFIGGGGWLTCSVIGCKEPGVSKAIIDSREREARSAELAKQMNTDYLRERKRAEAAEAALTKLRGERDALIQEHKFLNALKNERSDELAKLREDCARWAPVIDSYVEAWNNLVAGRALADLAMELRARSTATPGEAP